MVLKRDGDFSGRHTKNHTTQIGPSRYELRLYHPEQASGREDRPAG
jgi:hypothetical protein